MEDNSWSVAELALTELVLLTAALEDEEDLGEDLEEETEIAPAWADRIGL